MLERDQGAAPSRKYFWVRFCFPRPDADPVHLVADSLCFGLGAGPANPNDRIEAGVPESPHAVPYPKAPSSARIAFMGSLVD